MSRLIHVETLPSALPRHAAAIDPTSPSRDLLSDTARRLAVAHLHGLLKDLVPSHALDRLEGELERLFADPRDDAEASLARLRFIRDLALSLG